MQFEINSRTVRGHLERGIGSEFRGQFDENLRPVRGQFEASQAKYDILASFYNSF